MTEMTMAAVIALLLTSVVLEYGETDASPGRATAPERFLEADSSAPSSRPAEVRLGADDQR